MARGRIIALVSGIRRRLGRPIQKKFKSALPGEGGDGLLLPLLGKVLSRPGLAERVYGEGEVFLIKGGLFMSGVRLDDSAYEEVGSQWKEDQGQHHYNPPPVTAAPARYRTRFSYPTASICP